MSDLDDDNKKYAYYDVRGNDKLPPYNPRTREDLLSCIKDVGDAALRAKKAGFDCVELHAAHSDGLILAGSLNPFINNRTDDFGGALENRLRMCLEAIKDVRSKVGPDYPVLIRLNGDDLMGELGNTIEDICSEVIPALEAAGIDAFDISAGGPLYQCDGPEPQMYLSRGCWMHLAAAVKKVTTKPVIGVGRITTVEMGEHYLQRGDCDIVYYAREGHCDPEFPNKYLAGQTRPENARQCIGCLHSGCLPCTVSFEREDVHDCRLTYHPIVSSEKAKKVVVIGGGIAGMEAARVLTMRGHKVTLFEKRGELGGAINTLSKVQITSEFRNIIDYLTDQMRQLKVDVRCCHAATIDDIREIKPDAVVMATGFEMMLPKEVAGQPMVMTHLDAIERRREFRSYGQWKKKILIYGFTAEEFALDLAAEGAEVTLMGNGGETTMCAEPWMGRDRKYHLRRQLLDRPFIRRQPEHMRNYNVKILYHAKLVGVENGNALVYYHGAVKKMPYDVLIVSGARKKNDEMYEQIKELVPETYKIGDCEKMVDIHHATVTANEVALKI